MPELPEVETLRQGLRPRLVGRAFTRVVVLPDNPKLVREPSPDEFCRQLTDRRVEDIDRRGKYLIFRLDDGHAFVAHLRMTGAFLHRRPEDPPDAYLRAAFSLDDGSELRYRDPRKLGTMWLVDDPARVVGRLGPEALGEELTAAELGQRLRRRSAAIKAVLLNQEVLAGLGNIYADESLFWARLHPTRSCNSLTPDEVEWLHSGIVRALGRGVDLRGSSFRWFVDAQGRKGEQQHHVMVFRRTGQPCYQCGTPIGRIKLGGRSSHFCPRCQPGEDLA